MTVPRPTLLLFNTAMFRVLKVNDESVMRANPQEQARILCAILVSAVPSAVCRAFLELVGGDMEKLFEVGNDPVLHRHPHHQRGNRLTPQQITEIKRAVGSTTAICARFGIHRSTVYRLRKED